MLSLLAAAAIVTALDAERAFARDAQRMGQWTAFRKYADRDAVMFNPQAVWARDFLKGRKDPGASVHWWASDSYVSCDGRTAVTTGPWISGDAKSHGNFTTVWQRGRSGWRWVYDAGSTLKGALPKRAAPKTHRASCRTRAPGAPIIPPPALTQKQAQTTPQDNGRGQSADRTLGWDWKVTANGRRQFRAYLWNGRRYRVAVKDEAPPQ
jgi:hypothetical protein